MVFWLIFLSFLLLPFFFIQTILKSGKPINLPPGPSQLPIIGNLHQLGKNPHQALAELANIHGPIMSLKLGRITTIVISSSSAAKQVLQKKDLAFSSRFIPDAFHTHNNSQFALGWLPAAGAQWRMLRKILATNIFSGNRLDSNKHLRSRKVRELIACCEESSKTGKVVNIGRLGFQTTLNILSNTIFSKDLINLSDQESEGELKVLVNNLTREGGKPNLVDYFPSRVLRILDLQGIRRRMVVYHGKLLELLDELINERMMLKKKREDGNDDVLDSFLQIREEKPNEFNTLQTRYLISGV